MRCRIIIRPSTNILILSTSGELVRRVSLQALAKVYLAFEVDGYFFTKIKRIVK